MPEPFMAGAFSSAPVRIHRYTSGAFMFVDAANRGCWTDPAGRVLLPSLAVVDAILRAHGYERRDMRVVPTHAAPPVPVAPPVTTSAEDAETAGLEPPPESPEPPPLVAPGPVPAEPKKRGRPRKVR